MGMLNQIVELLEDRRIFVRQRKSHKTKVIALLVYHAGLSYRKTSAIIGNLESFSHEALRKWYKKCVVFFCPQRKQRPVIAVDETKVKWEGRQIYIWNTIDIEDHVVLAVYASVSRTSFDAIFFLKKVLNYCENKPFILVDGGPWYRWAFQRLGLDWEHQTFGERNHIEQWYNQYKERVKRFWKRFPYHSTLQSISQWSLAWTGLYNLLLEVS
jgi:transposase-like protein